MENQEQKPQQTFSERMEESQQAASPTQEGGVPPTQPKKESSGGVNKYFIIVGAVVLIIVLGALYRTFFVAEIDKPVVTGVEKALSIVTHENTWSFDPEIIEIDQGDRIILTITNEDEYDHGFAIDAFGISQRMPAKGTIVVDFVVTKAGEFPFYCSVSCGSGIVHGEERGHFDQIGRLHVRSIISETTNFAPEEPAVDFAAEARKSAMIKEASRALDVAPEEIQVDNENTLWLETGRTLETLETLENIDYQALYYQPDDGDMIRNWVFIDTTTGEVIDTTFDE